jgi:lipopolysaccharide biosynthesis regulator YciM
VTGTPIAGETGPTFPSERERAQKAVEEFQKVQSGYGAPYSELARYFAAVNLVTVDRNKGLGELEAIAKGGNSEVAGRAKFALAQAREADAQYDAAASIYQELLKSKDGTISENTLNLRLAAVYEKQNKKDEAADILFRMVEAARKEVGKDGKPAQPSATIRAASERLQTLSPARYAQLPAEPPPASSIPF